MQEELNQFIERALHEDVRDGDHTSIACIPANAKGKAHLLVKEKWNFGRYRISSPDLPKSR